ncbi:MAG TPA: alcohol dehydrogenase catalytic domain-containing protein, partial [Thermobifida alba]|nr:alcohol dehydrogenase catalytic domain-containing protein [Thermobifida alba]
MLVEVRAAALNDTGLWPRQGSCGTPGDPDALAGWRGPVGFPRIRGADVAGVVVSAGTELVGRRVVLDPAIDDAETPDANPAGLMGSERDGGYAEYVTAPARRVHDVADSPLSDVRLAALPTAYGTAPGMTRARRGPRGRHRRGDRCLGG